MLKNYIKLNFQNSVTRSVFVHSPYYYYYYYHHLLLFSLLFLVPLLLLLVLLQASDTGNIKAMYDGIKKAVGPTISKSAPLKSQSEDIISDKTKQLEKWLEHYSELYSRENTVSQSALDAIERLTTLQELDDPPSLEDVSKAIINFP